MNTYEPIELGTASEETKETGNLNPDNIQETTGNVPL
jgi:hypothetical protein